MAADRGSGGGAGHQPVMVDEVIEFLSPKVGGRYLDMTLGGGGHAREILRRIGPTGMLVGVDRDNEVLERTEEELCSEFANLRLFHCNFAEFDELRRVKLPIRFDGLLLDLGVSSFQLDEDVRGFSFMRSGPLDMRMDRTGGVTAGELLKTISVEDLEKIIREYGEERYARRIARAIVEQRRRRRLVDTAQLASVIERAVPSRRGRIHPATRTFQALRIAVNDELGNLEKFLARFHQLLNPQGTIVVLSFQSLEDRLVKERFRQGRREGWLEVLTRKPLTATREEVKRNRRARSAKLRAARTTGSVPMSGGQRNETQSDSDAPFAGGSDRNLPGV